jgi:hypothetical protein
MTQTDNNLAQVRSERNTIFASDGASKELGLTGEIKISRLRTLRRSWLPIRGSP